MASNYTYYVEHVLRELKWFAQRDETALSAKRFFEGFTTDRILCWLCLPRTDDTILKAEWLQEFFKEKLLEFRRNREYLLTK